MADEKFHLMIDVAALPDPGDRPHAAAPDGSIYLGTIAAGSTVGQFDERLGGWPVAHPEQPARLITPCGIAVLIDGIWTITRDVFAPGSRLTVEIGESS